MAIEIGKQYGNWLVLSRNDAASEEYSKKQNHKRNCWNCECICCKALEVKNDYTLQDAERHHREHCQNCQGEDLTGKKFGRLTVRCRSPRIEYGKRFWICDCECGGVVEHETGHLNSKQGPKSCGCLQKEIAGQTAKSNAKWNGDSKNEKSQRLYHIWCAMRNRCESNSNIHYNEYGGRGITVCKEWHDWMIFKDWSLNHGYKDDLTIDRIDTNGNYEPNNCRWVTQKEQANNTRSNKYLTYKGRTQTLSQWCEELGLDYFRTKARLNTCGYSVEDAFEQEKYYFQKNVQHKKVD